MDNKETNKELLAWCERNNGTFSWPTDACGYEQHMKFVAYRNKYWKGQMDFKAFVKQYAKTLDTHKEHDDAQM